MKLEEIWINPPRDEFLYDKIYHFINAKSIAKIHNLILKKTTNDEDIYYGLFNKSALVGFLWITKFDDELYQVILIQLEPQYKGYGYATFLYDYVVLNDKISLLSDNRQTPDSRRMWQHFKQNGHFIIKAFNTSTKQVVETPTEQQVYDNDNIVWLALPTGNNINESLALINKKYKGKRYVNWYGPGTSSEEYWNP